MLRLHVPLPTRYVDFGKVFVPNGALDFSTLAASDLEVARFGPQLFNRGLVFPDSSPFAAQIGSVSAALLMFEGGYLFTLVQRRREGELSVEPRTDRPFNQVRFILLSREQIEQAFAARASLYSSLALAARDRESRVWLRDYTATVDPQAWQPSFERLDPAAPSPEAVRFVANALVAAAAGDKPQPISVPLPGQDLLEKLQLIEAVQYWLLPKLGVLSFALDYVSIQNVHLRLFALPPDAPAPLPPERVFLPGPVDARFVDDYHTPISGLSPEALTDPALPGLLALRLSTAVSVSLYKVEKLAEPLPGAQAVALYPELARLGERRLGFLRRVPAPDRLELLRQPDLPAELRLDLLQVALETAHGLLVLYAPAHLAVPRPARDDERVRALLRASLAKSPEASLGVGTPADQSEIYRDLLLARRGPPFAGRGQPPPPPAVVLDTGQPVLEALMLWRRTPALTAALAEVVPQVPALFTDALAVLDHVTDLPGLVWLWRSAGGRDPKKYAALLERAVQPAWYPALARDAVAWQSLLADGRALALEAAGAGEPGPGVLLRSLPRPLVPFVWQACLATAEHNAVFAEWWLFNEALALPDQLPAFWDALQKLPAAVLGAASPELNYLLGRAQGHSLLRACTPPGADEPNEALYAAALRGWLATGFRSPVGDLALGTDDVEFLIAHLPGSNDILAAVAASAAQASAIRGLSAAQALLWARTAAGDRRQPYRVGGKDWLLQRLLDLPAADDNLRWHLLVEDDGTAPSAMPWADYAALVARVRAQLTAPLSSESGGAASSPRDTPTAHSLPGEPLPAPDFPGETPLAASLLSKISSAASLPDDKPAAAISRGEPSPAASLTSQTSGLASSPHEISPAPSLSGETPPAPTPSGEMPVVASLPGETPPAPSLPAQPSPAPSLTAKTPGVASSPRDTPGTASPPGGTRATVAVTGLRVPALLDVAGALQNPELPVTFYQNQIDIRRVLALLAVHPIAPAAGGDLGDSLVPLTVFHLQETNPDLRARAAELLSAGLQQADVQKTLHGLPDNVLIYLRDAICQGQPALTAPSHWIDAELSRRKNAYRLEVAARAASPRRDAARPPDALAGAAPAGPAAGPGTAALSRGPDGSLPPVAPFKSKVPATPAPPPPSSRSAPNAADAVPLLGQLALPTATRKKADSAVWLWIAIVVMVLLTIAIVIGALLWVQSLA